MSYQIWEKRHLVELLRLTASLSGGCCISFTLVSISGDRMNCGLLASSSPARVQIKNGNPTQVDSTCRASAARKHAYPQAHKHFAKNKEAHKHTYIRASPQSTAHSASKSARGATFPPPQMLYLVQLIGIQQCCYSNINSTQTSSVSLG